MMLNTIAILIIKNIITNFVKKDNLKGYTPPGELPVPMKELSAGYTKNMYTNIYKKSFGNTKG